MLDAHDVSLSKGGGRRGVSSLASIEGAIGRPYHGYHRRIWEKAAALLHGLSTSHGFIDGNKRTSWLTTFILIEQCNYHLKLSEGDMIDQVVVEVVEGVMSQDRLELWFQERLLKSL